MFYGRFYSNFSANPPLILFFGINRTTDDESHRIDFLLSFLESKRENRKFGILVQKFLDR
jgi:hypothetical protein